MPFESVLYIQNVSKLNRRSPTLRTSLRNKANFEDLFANSKATFRRKIG